MNGDESKKISPNEELNYLLNFNNLYVGHLNSVFNFFVVFSAFIINALAFVLKEANSLPSFMDEAIILFSLFLSILFFALDLRTRQIIAHLEKSLLDIETKSMNSSTKYLREMPKPQFWSLARHGVLFPMVYFVYSVLMIALLFII